MTDVVKQATSYLETLDDGYVQAKVGLVRKQAALKGEIEGINRELAQKIADLRAIEAALRVLDPGVDTDALPSRRPNTPFAAFRGELARFLLTELRNAPEGLTTREATVALMGSRGMDPADPGAVKLMHRRVAHSLQKLRDKGMLRSEAVDATGMLRWGLVG